MVLVDYNFTRLRTDGSEMSTGAVFYVVKKLDKGWRIIAFYGHCIDERVELVPAK